MGRPGVAGLRSARLLAVAVLLFLLAAALYVRLPGYDGRPLWIDELWRVNLILDPDLPRRYFSSPDVYTAITSPLYAAFTRTIALFGRSPEVLRLGSLLPGLAAVAVAFLLALRARAGLLAAAAASLAFALNADFVRYSNELKPYAFEVFVHLACVLALLDLLLLPEVSRGRWTAFFTVLAAALLSAANAVTLLPAIAAAVLLHARLSPEASLREPLAGFAGLAGLAALMYFFVWSHGSDKDLIRYWAWGFNSDGAGHYPGFLAERFREMWKAAFSLVGERSVGMPFHRTALAALLAAAACHFVYPRQFVAGIGARIVLFYFVFFAILACLNYLGMWPLGALRPNLFVYAHFIALVFLLIASIPSRLARGAICLVLLAELAATLALVSRPQLESASAPLERHDLVLRAFGPEESAGKRITAQCRTAKPLVFFNPGMSHALAYYRGVATMRESEASMLLGDCVDLRAMPDAYVDLARARSAIASAASGAPFWVVYSHIDRGDPEYRVMRDLLAEFGELRTAESFSGAGYFEVER